MTWLDVVRLCMTVTDTVIEAAWVWGPLLVAVAGLLLVVRCRTGARPRGDMYAGCPDNGRTTQTGGRHEGG